MRFYKAAVRQASRIFAVATLLSFALSAWGFAPSALAATPTTITIQPSPPPASAPNLLITSIVGSAQLDYLELYNQSDSALSLDGFKAQIAFKDTAPGGCANTTAEFTLPTSWLLPKKYLTFQRSSMAVSPLTMPFTIDPALFTGCITPVMTAITIVHAADEPLQVLALPGGWTTTTVAQHKQRSNSPSSTRTITGSFLDDYKIVTGDIKLDSDPLYTPPADSAGLQILEILPTARSCSPLETNPTCNDYIKLYNPTDQPINLAAYRLRVGYKGQSSSVTNTLTWGRAIDPSQDELILPGHTYFMLSSRNDGAPLSITDGGNYVWLEDAYGALAYEPIVQYPDASSTTKVGSAWAFDGTAWRWTSMPQPNAPNYFPPEIPLTASVDIASGLKPCAANQYRNPETNRCNTIVASAAILTPCDPGEERNPATNRCRSVVTASSELAPCQPGWERNPDTNRCRKVTTPAVQGAATTAITDTAAPTMNNTGWFVAGIAILAALSYAVYEWRQDITLVSRRLRTIPVALYRKLRK